MTDHEVHMGVTLTKLVASDEGFDGRGSTCLAHFKIDTQEKAKFFKIEIPAKLAHAWGKHLGSKFKMALAPMQATQEE